MCALLPLWFVHTLYTGFVRLIVYESKEKRDKHV